MCWRAGSCGGGLEQEQECNFSPIFHGTCARSMPMGKFYFGKVSVSVCLLHYAGGWWWKPSQLKAASSDNQFTRCKGISTQSVLNKCVFMVFKKFGYYKRIIIKVIWNLMIKSNTRSMGRLAVEFKYYIFFFKISNNIKMYHNNIKTMTNLNKSRLTTVINIFS